MNLTTSHVGGITTQRVISSDSNIRIWAMPPWRQNNSKMKRNTFKTLSVFSNLIFSSNICLVILKLLQVSDKVNKKQSFSA